MRRVILSIAAVISVLLATEGVYGFCGFYVAKADAKLFNKASQVVLVRQDDKTVLTMANDFKGNLQEFAIVIPVPTFIEKGQIHVGDSKIINHLDAYTAPRLVEYFDENPCHIRAETMMDAAPASVTERMRESKTKKDGDYGVTVEAEYTIGEYDIVILSAKESGGLEAWLKDNGYRIPTGAAAVLGSYIKQAMRFFVAKVNLKEQSRLGFNYLRPIQVAYESPKFMLPIRLGTVNAEGAQELFIYALTQKGRIETTNYRNVKLPTDMNLPVYIKSEFPSFYKALFEKQVQNENMKTVFLEYAWDMNSCDPCAAEPLSAEELRNLGVFWLNQNSPAQNVFVTRLHVRYTADKFPEDLIFQETADKTNFQGRYVLRHPWTGTDRCAAADSYRQELLKRQESEAQTLATLTNWDIDTIRQKMGIQPNRGGTGTKKWWDGLWKE